MLCFVALAVSAAPAQAQQSSDTQSALTVSQPDGSADPTSDDVATQQPSQTNQSSPPNPGTATANPNSIVNGPNDWVHRWLRTVDKTRKLQPHYVAPLITTHVLLVQQYRFDSYYQSAKGYETMNYGANHGLEIIPWDRMEVQIAQPAYLFHQAPNTPNGWGDLSMFFKFRIASQPEGKGGYFIGFFTGVSIPTGTPPNGMGHAIWTPMFAAAKRWGFFDWQTNLAGSLPTGNIAVLGRQILYNNTFQFSVRNVVWPEVETNTTFIKDGPGAGNTENFMTPGVLIGPFQIAERLHIEPGFGYQVATSHYYTYNHRWIWTLRLPF